jgi:hypothetical protein
MERFWKNVDKTGCCWHWSSKNTNGPHSRCAFRGKTMLPHRVAWVLTFGEISDTTRLYHTCGDRQCCNPSHLNIKTEEERFWERVDKTNGCWNWTAHLDASGYGRFSWKKGEEITASRVAWRLTKGDIPAGLSVLHHCDNRKCCRPDHLYLGTKQDNMDDMVRRNRQSRGEDRPLAKLDGPKVLAIRGDTRRQKDIAEQYGVSQFLVSLIKRRKAWAHV